MTADLMNYVMLNFPTRSDFLFITEEILKANFPFLEVQIPFSNPTADGPVIQEAHHKALLEPLNLEQDLEKIAKSKQELNSKTKLVAMLYTTVLVIFGVKKFIKLLAKNGFDSLIVPDLPINSKEHHELLEILSETNLSWIPLVSPLTTSERMQEIQKFLKPGQLIYAMARKGVTGRKTDFNPEVIDYLKSVQNTFAEQKIYTGFGIQTKEQLQKLNNLGIGGIIASSLVKKLNKSKNSLTTTKEFLIEFKSD